MLSKFSKLKTADGGKMNILKEFIKKEQVDYI